MTKAKTGRTKITPATIRMFEGNRYYILTNPIPKAQANSIAKSYRRTDAGARVVKTADGYTVYVRSK